MRFIAAFVATLLFAPAAFADTDARDDKLANRLTTAGALTLGLSYAPMSIGGMILAAEGPSQQTWAGMSFVPIAGPFYYGSLIAPIADTPDARTIAAFAIADGIIQLAGVGLIIAGEARRHHVARAATPSLSWR